MSPKLVFTATEALSEYHCIGIDAHDKDVVEVSEEKAGQMIRDFPKNFKKVHDGKEKKGELPPPAGGTQQSKKE